jgi:hypothetical protein
VVGAGQVDVLFARAGAHHVPFGFGRAVLGFRAGERQLVVVEHESGDWIARLHVAAFFDQDFGHDTGHFEVERRTSITSTVRAATGIEGAGDVSGLQPANATKTTNASLAVASVKATDGR